MSLRNAVDQLIARSDEIRFDASSAGGPLAADRFFDEQIELLLQAEAAKLKPVEVPPPVISQVAFTELLRPLADIEAERQVMGQLLWLQPGPPTRYAGEAYRRGFHPAEILSRLRADHFTDEFLLWLYDPLHVCLEIGAANWVSYIMRQGRREINLEPRELMKLGAEAGLWCYLPYWLERLDAALDRRQRLAAAVQSINQVLSEVA